MRIGKIYSNHNNNNIDREIKKQMYWKKNKEKCETHGTDTAPFSSIQSN